MALIESNQVLVLDLITNRNTNFNYKKVRGILKRLYIYARIKMFTFFYGCFFSQLCLLIKWL